MSTRSASGHGSTLTIVFVGIGDVVPYVQDPINGLATFVDDSRIRVVSRSILTNWDKSQWKGIFQGLPIEQRLAMSADDFADDLARAWLKTHLLRKLDEVDRPHQKLHLTMHLKICQRLMHWHG